MSEISEYVQTATRHAAICLLWQADDAGEHGNGYPISDAGVNDDFDYVDAVIPLIRVSVAQFVRANWQTLRDAGVSAEQCGHDLILTANRHGTGFWDRGLDMPANDQVALTAYKQGQAFYMAYLANISTGYRPKTAGNVLTEAAHAYSFDAEFRLWDDDADGDEHLSDELAWLMVENMVLVDHLGWSA